MSMAVLSEEMHLWGFTCSILKVDSVAKLVCKHFNA